MQNRCHQCGKRTNLKKCRYCDEYFCEDHLPAKMCLTRAILDDKKLHPSIRTELEKEWRKEGGHPDAEYTSQRWKKFDRKEKEYHESVSKFLDASKTEKTIPVAESPAEENFIPINPLKEKSYKTADYIWDDVKGHHKHNFHNKNKSFRFPSNKIIILMIIFAAVVYFMFFSPAEIKNNISNSIENILQKLSHNKISNSEPSSSLSGTSSTDSNPHTVVITKISDIIGNMNYFNEKNVTIAGMFEKMGNGYYVNDNSGRMKIGYTNIMNLDRNNIFDNNKKYNINGSIITANNENLISIISYEDIKSEEIISTATVRTESYRVFEADIPFLEEQVHKLINEERQKNNLSNLSWDNKLADIARSHSKDMANRNFFSHINPDGNGPTERGTSAGYYCHKDYGTYYTEGLAENLFQNNLYDSITYYNGIPSYHWNTQTEIASSTVNGWMSSPGHRQNILTATYDKEGIGIAISTDDKVYITQDFC